MANPRFDANPNANLELVAVYGSLMQVEGGFARLGALPFLEYRGPARLPGQLFDLGDYPGLCWDEVVASESRSPGVPGELYAVLQPQVLAVLDEYEGCSSPARQESGTGFRRIKIMLLEPAVQAWVYLYYGPVAGLQPVSGMSWPQYKAARSGCGNRSDQGS